ncbi:MAG: hypothetical protein WB816_16055 [Methylocystis sp.]
MTPAAFYRAFPMSARTLCSEPVVAWAHLHGHQPLRPLAQLLLWRKNDVTTCAALVAARWGLDEIAPEDASIGDIGVVDCINDGAMDRIIGLSMGSFFVIGGFGEVRIGRFPIKRAWRMICRP